MPPSFDFDRLSTLAREDPLAFEACRHALFEAAFAELPEALQAGARAHFAQVQLKMLAAKTPAERLAVSLSALSESLLELQLSVASLRREAQQQMPQSSRWTAA